MCSRKKRVLTEDIYTKSLSKQYIKRGGREGGGRSGGQSQYIRTYGDDKLIIKLGAKKKQITDTCMGKGERKGIDRTEQG